MKLKKARYVTKSIKKNQGECIMNHRKCTVWNEHEKVEWWQVYNANQVSNPDNQLET